MNTIKLIIDFCISILNIEINLFGFNISMLGVLIYCIIAFLLSLLLFGLLK